MLCIRRELAAGLPTPPEDQSLRREYQMRLLVEHMGKGGAAAAGEDAESLVLEWVRIGGVAPEIYDALLKRFRGSGAGAGAGGAA